MRFIVAVLATLHCGRARVLVCVKVDDVPDKISVIAGTVESI